VQIHAPKAQLAGAQPEEEEKKQKKQQRGKKVWQTFQRARSAFGCKVKLTSSIRNTYPSDKAGSCRIAQLVLLKLAETIVARINRTKIRIPITWLSIRNKR
jgi:hypothetical protein